MVDAAQQGLITPTTAAVRSITGARLHAKIPRAGLDYQDKRALSRITTSAGGGGTFARRSSAPYNLPVARAEVLPPDSRDERISPLGRGPASPSTWTGSSMAAGRAPRCGTVGQCLNVSPGDGDWTHDGIIAFTWQGSVADRLLVAVNYAPNQSQCHVRMPFADLGGKQWRIEDQLDAAAYDWNGNDLAARGLYLDMKPWQAAVYRLVQRD